MARRKRTRGRNISGILLLDKPSGVTSNQVLQHIKRIYRANKAGHTGSLDKQATGLLPLCFGEATKFSGYLLDADKQYRATCMLGVTTTTGDSAGEITASKPVPKLTRERVEQVLADFRGTISQVPPMYSALKHKGQRLYKLAYQGVEVAREPREVIIYQLDLLQIRHNEIDISVNCSKGTYIRTLAEDIGRNIGCGAHIKALRRIGSGPFTGDLMVGIEVVEQAATRGESELDSLLQPVDLILGDTPDVYLDENLVFYLRQGQAVIVPKSPTVGIVRIYNRDRQFQGIGEVLDDGRISPRRLVQA